MTPMYVPEAPRTRPEGDIAIMSHVPKGYKVQHAEAVLQDFLPAAGSSASSSSSSSTPSKSKSSKKPSSGRPLSDLADLSIKSERYVMKALPGQGNRVYSIGFHPSTDRLVSIIGGRFGELSLWSPDVGVSGANGASAASSSSSSKRHKGEDSEKAAGASATAGEEEEEEEDDAMKTLAVVNFHSSVINSFKVPSACPTILVTTS